MSVFTSRVTVTLPVPSESDQSITIRKLNPKGLQAARSAAQQQSMSALRDIGGPAFLQELQALQTKDAEGAAKAIADPMNLYDALTVLKNGVTAWTYDVPVSAEALADLDEETTAWLAKEIVQLSRPSDFLTAPEAEAAAKND